MRKRIFGRKLKRTTNQRKALFRSLTNALVLHGKIKTTEAKAKSVKGQIEKLITKAKKHEKDALHFLERDVQLATAERIVTIASVFKDRPGGYLRIIKIGNRKKDNAPLVLLEFVEKIEPVKKETKREKKSVKTESKKKETKLALVKEVKPKAEKKSLKTK